VRNRPDTLFILFAIMEFGALGGYATEFFDIADKACNRL
jgi:hypothetical protein